MSPTVVVVVLGLGAVFCFGAFSLYGAWLDGKQLDGKRQTVREHGSSLVTDADISVHAREEPPC